MDIKCWEGRELALSQGSKRRGKPQAVAPAVCFVVISFGFTSIFKVGRAMIPGCHFGSCVFRLQLGGPS